MLDLRAEHEVLPEVETSETGYGIVRGQIEASHPGAIDDERGFGSLVAEVDKLAGLL